MTESAKLDTTDDPFDQEAFFASFVAVITDIASGRSDASLQYRSQLDAAYQQLEDMEKRQSLRNLGIDRRKRLAASIKRVRKAYCFARSPNPQELHIGQTIILSDGIAAVQGFDQTSLGVYYRVETSSGDITEIFGGPGARLL